MLRIIIMLCMQSLLCIGMEHPILSNASRDPDVEELFVRPRCPVERGIYRYQRNSEELLTLGLYDPEEGIRYIEKEMKKIQLYCSSNHFDSDSLGHCDSVLVCMQKLKERCCSMPYDNKAVVQDSIATRIYQGYNPLSSVQDVWKELIVLKVYIAGSTSDPEEVSEKCDLALRQLDKINVRLR